MIWGEVHTLCLNLEDRPRGIYQQEHDWLVYLSLINQLQHPPPPLPRAITDAYSGTYTVNDMLIHQRVIAGSHLRDTTYITVHLAIK